MGYVPNFKKHYYENVVPQLIEEGGYKSTMQVPRIQKIVVNQGVGAATQDKKLVETAREEISMITGQHAVITKAKNSISNFKLREGMPIGVKVTLRKDQMYEFMERLVSVALPRVRDFRGISDKSFDGRGNYSFGIKEHIIFPEIDLDKVKSITGMEITFVTSAETDAECYKLLKLMGMPFKNNKNQ